jgi:hypothetical protein
VSPNITDLQRNPRPAIPRAGWNSVPEKARGHARCTKIDLRPQAEGNDTWACARRARSAPAVIGGAISPAEGLSGLSGSGSTENSEEPCDPGCVVAEQQCYGCYGY